MKKGFQTHRSFFAFSSRTPARWFMLALLAVTAGLCVHLWLMRSNGQAQAAVLWPVKQSGPGSPDGVWQALSGPELGQSPWATLNVAPGRSFRALRLNLPALQGVLRKTPLENTVAVSESVLSLPLPDGSFARFQIEESPTMEPALAAQFPEIKSYRGQGLDDPAMQVRFDWSPRGLHALLLKHDESISIQPLQQQSAGNDDHTLYLSFSGQDAINPQDFECLTEQLSEAQGDAARGYEPRAFSFGNVRRNFRIAIATTVEYTNAANLGGGSASSALASVNTWLNAVNLIYERDLSVHFNLVANNNLVIFTTTDSFTNGDAVAMLSQVRGVLANTIGSANYDLGHVLGTGSSGIANLGVVCYNAGSTGPAKGSGVSLISPNATVGNSFYITRIAHEIGHQFGATHSFNDTDPNYTCISARTSTSAWESGSGLTVMSYAGSCNPITTSRAQHFHGGSIAQMADYIENLAPCAANANYNNNPPTVNGGNDYHIPRNTPFALSATASDADATDVSKLSYSWEEFDAGGANYGNPPFTDAGDPSSTTRPIFRPYAPANSPTRFFPSLTYILNNANVPPLTREENSYEVFTGESLPQVARTLNFKVIVRDQRGGVADDTVALTVVSGAGPFAVTAPNTNVSWAGGSSQTVTWSVNNTNAAPINCAQVRILLSTDGGNTFPHTLLSSTANDGSETIVVPSGLSSTTARLKVEAVGNIFFDISNTNFTLTPGSAACPTISALNPNSGQVGSSVTITGTNFTGVSAVKFSNNVNAVFTVNSNTQITTTVPTGATTGALTFSKTGCNNVQSASFTIASCNYSLDATTRSVAATAGSNSVNVTTGAGCAWAAASNVNWLTITNGASHNGSGAANFSIAANTGPARTGTLTIAGQTVTVTQAAASVGNPPQISTLSPAFIAAGNAQFTLTVNGANLVNGAVVRWNGSNRATTFVSTTKLTATIPAADVAAAGTASVTVFDATTGTTSNAVSFVIAGTLANVSAASYDGAQFAPNQIVAVFGQNLATATTTATTLPLPTTLGGTSVKVKDSAGVERLAPLFFVSAKQINYLLPTGTANGAALVTITCSDGHMSVGQINGNAVAPGLFSANANGQGVAAGVALRVSGNTQRFEALSRFDAASNKFVSVPIDLGPATDQVYLVLYGTGLRQRSALSNVVCNIGGVTLTPAYVGAQGSLAGLDQVNLLLPRTLAGRGEISVTLTVDGKQTNTVKVQIK
jgi:uncharacterized protein (TIGR03437 family)